MYYNSFFVHATEYFFVCELVTCQTKTPSNANIRKDWRFVNANRHYPPLPL